MAPLRSSNGDTFEASSLSLDNTPAMDIKDLATVQKVMRLFVEDNLEGLGMDFQVWNWTRNELFGLILGMFVKTRLVSDSSTLTRILEFTVDVAHGYLENPYHSFLHAVDVTYIMYWTLSDMRVADQLKLNKMEMAALLIAALTHDIQHPGLNNLYQVNAHTPLAIRYNNQSVLEAHSCTEVQALLDKHPFLNDLCYGDCASETSDPPSYIRSIIVEAIMSTDMCHHFELLSQLSCITEQHIGGEVDESESEDEAYEDALSGDGDGDVDADVEADTEPEEEQLDASDSGMRDEGQVNGYHIAEGCGDFVPRGLEGPPNHDALLWDPWDDKGPAVDSHHVVGVNGFHVETDMASVSISRVDGNGPDIVLSATSVGNSESSDDVFRFPAIPPPLPLSTDEKRKMINVILHAADISNAARPFGICKRWSDMVVQEFFFQGQQEKYMKLPVSPNMDAETTNPVQIAIDFNEYVVRQFFEVLAEMMPSTRPFVELLISNARQWKDVLKDGATMAVGVGGKVDGRVDGANTGADDAAGVTAGADSPLGGEGGGSGGTSAPGTPGVEPGQRGRRLSIAAGTVDIPDSFDRLLFKKAKYKNRYKTSRSLSSGRGSSSASRKSMAGLFRSATGAASSSSLDALTSLSDSTRGPFSPSADRGHGTGFLTLSML
ncbi:hypothetical protein HK104_004410, partial [Borealophlyctis nickersoniae]